MERTLFDDDHELFRDSVRGFIAKELAPHHEEWERAGVVDRDLFRKAGAQGFLGMAVPEDLGGGGVDDFRYNVVIAEEVQRADVGAAGLGWTLHNDICLPYFLTLCTDEQKARWLPGICSGELITAIAMTEPGIGSDLASMATTAIRDGDHYVVNGSKTFITNGINADLVITAVKTDPTQRHAGMSLVVLERGMEGFERGRNLEKVGMHAQDTAELFFSDVHVPVENRLGDEGSGFRSLVGKLPQERLSIGVTGVAAAARALELTLEYTKERTAFGKPIGTFQNSRFKLAEMATEVAVAQTFVDRCVLALNAGELTA
ncbi:MAG TPA: acyl-CoA dehydrogenase family protein, partial [Acidimicrobiales bacterium]